MALTGVRLLVLVTLASAQLSALPAAYDFATRWSAGPKVPVSTNRRMLNNPISYIYDGMHVSRNGWIFAGCGEGLTVINPVSGLTLGAVRVGGGDYGGVTLAFGEHELWIVGKGGVWHVSNIAERLV